MSTNNVSSSSSSSSGIGFTGLLTIVFIVLKLTDVIGWSWWWVLSPLWIAWGSLILILISVFVVFLAKELRKDKKARQKRARSGYR